MSFIERMTAESGAPEPRWLYLLRKPLDTWGIALILYVLAGVPLTSAAFIAAVVYVAIGQITWWTSHPFTWWGTNGRGGLLGDVWYHLWVGLVPAIVLTAQVHGPAFTLLMLAVWGFCWWELEGAGFGVVRAG